MKKCFTMLLSVGLAGICAIGIAACGGASSAKNIVSDIVTQEEWEAAFAEENFDNFKLEYVYEAWTDDSKWEEGSSNEQYQWIIVCENEKIHQKVNATGYSGNRHVSYVDERYYDPFNELEYVKDENNQWINAADYYSDDFSIGDKSCVLGEFLESEIHFGDCEYIDFADSFDLFEYSEKEKGYLYEYREQDEGGHENIFRLILKFKKGKFAGYSSSQDSWDGTEFHIKESADLVVTYGGQHVTLPEVSEAE